MSVVMMTNESTVLVVSLIFLD